MVSHGNFPDINFILNDLEPPIAIKDCSFDVIYCISVFTHLSEARHYQWIDEISRLLKPGGLFVGTFRGEWFRKDLTCDERLQFDKGVMVIRDKIKEGKKDYAAYHCDSFVTSLLSSFRNTRKLDPVSNFVQSMWIASK
jgi:SAM-dependent methyltransferase